MSVFIREKLKMSLPTTLGQHKWFLLLSLLGMAVSYYTVFVGNSRTRDPSYKALCDISESISCSDVVTSP